MLASLLQVAGLVAVVVCASLISVLAGGMAVGAVFVYVGAAMERD
jgi:hypothetical protein